MDSGLKLWGVMTASALVLPSSTPTLMKAAARLAKVVFRDRIQICNGTNDHVGIQATLDALPATGGEVFLLDGTYNIEASLVMDSYQTLRGCGRNTILTTTTAALHIITATGGAGTEKIGILIADLCVDGNAGGVANGIGIWLTYCDYSKIRNVWSQDNGVQGIKLDRSDFCEIIGNTCQENSYAGIQLYFANHNTVMGNTSSGNIGVAEGIQLYDSLYNSITGNICQGNGYGLKTDIADSNTISENICQGNTYFGIYFEGDFNIFSGNNCRGNGREGIASWGTNRHNIIIGNVCVENSQATDNTYDNINITNGEYHLIMGNVCRKGALANEPRYGINISDAASEKNIVQGNDLHDAGKTANFNDAGTCTIVEDDNREIGVNQVKRYVYMKNTSAAQRVAGDVVVFKTGVAAGDEFTTTVTLGDDHVLGMVAETIAVDAYGYVLVAGKTVVLKGSNDNGNIAVGDFLCTSDTAVEAVLAGALDTAFAISLEALAAAGPEPLDALLINPMTF